MLRFRSLISTRGMVVKKMCTQSVLSTEMPLLVPVNLADSLVNKATLTVALVGRPNTGKSTLFNRLTNSKQAIVSAVPGTTRDRREGVGYLAGMPLHVVDTGGLDDRGEVSTHIKQQVLSAVKEADVLLFMLDVKTGVTPLDKHFAQWLRRIIGQVNIESNSDIDINAETTINDMNNILDKRVIVLANKAEGAHNSDTLLDTAAEALQLGFGDVIPLSAAHGDGLADLATELVLEARLRDCLEDDPSSETKKKKKNGVVKHPTTAMPSNERTIQMALMGRPNVGKSTMVNSLIGKERVIAGPIAGLTRDAVQVAWKYDDRQIILVDTAGLTRTRPVSAFLDVKREGKAVSKQESLGMPAIGPTSKELGIINGLTANKVKVPLPGVRSLDPESDPSQHSYLVSELSLLSALNALKYAQIVCLIVDSEQQQFSKVDLQLARLCLKEGRGLVILANKQDIVEERGVSATAFADGVKLHADEYLREFGDIPVIPTSGLNNRGLDRVMREVIRTHDSWSKRIETWLLNRWIRDTMASAPAPRASDKNIKIKYMTQISSRPPDFLLSTNVEELPGHFERYLRSRIQQDFDLRGVPIRFTIRKSQGNPVKKELLKHNISSRRHKGHSDSRGVGPKKRDINIAVKRHVHGDERDQRRRRDTRNKRIIKK
jgi:GTPase